MAVMVPMAVPFTRMLAPGTAALSSALVTVPVIDISWADKMLATISKQDRIKNFFIILVLDLVFIYELV
jgi:hypothetical protein